MEQVYLSLGSNLGDRARLLRSALDLLDTPQLRIRRVSSIYETKPAGQRDQPWFLNLVAEAETEMSPAALLERIQAVEAGLGRERLQPGGPRTIDIDILFHGDAVIDSADLTIPHPRLAERRFVLEPLAELTPELRHPITGRSVAEMLEATRCQVVRRWP